MKLLGSLIASMALGLSLLVAVPTAASAAPYPGTVATSCGYGVPNSVRRNRNFNVAYRVTAAGNARPYGEVYFLVYKIRNRRAQFNRAFSNGYTGPGIRIRSLGKFQKKGRYLTKMVFRANRNSVYKDCNSGFRAFRVKR